MGMVGEACFPSNAYYPRMPEYTFYSGVHASWSEHSDSSFVYRFMSLDYGLGAITTTTLVCYGAETTLLRPCLLTGVVFPNHGSHNVRTTSYQSRCNVRTLIRRCVVGCLMGKVLIFLYNTCTRRRTRSTFVSADPILIIESMVYPSSLIDHNLYIAGTRIVGHYQTVGNRQPLVTAKLLVSLKPLVNAKQ